MAGVMAPAGINLAYQIACNQIDCHHPSRSARRGKGQNWNWPRGGVFSLMPGSVKEVTLKYAFAVNG